MENGNTENYEVPVFVIKPYPGDKGFPLVKNNLKQSDWSLKKKKNKSISKFLTKELNIYISIINYK